MQTKPTSATDLSLFRMCCLSSAQVVGKGMGPEPDRVTARAAGGEAAQGVKRSRFALEAEEQQVSVGACSV